MPDRTPPPFLTRPVLIASLIALLVTLALALDLTPLLRGGAGWRWPYSIPDPAAWLLPGLVALATYLGVGLWALRHARRTWLFLLWCTLGGLGVQIAFLAFYGPPLEQLFLRTVSSVAGGFFEVGVASGDMLDTLRHYPELMPGWTAHPKAHPPGIPLLFWAGSRLLALTPGLADALADPFRVWQCHHRVLMSLTDPALAAAAVGMLVPAAGALGVYPAFDLARRISGEQAGRAAALWLPLMPSLVMFTPQWNQLYALLALAVVWLVWRGLGEARPFWLAACGLLLSAATFLSFTAVNLIGLAGLVGLLTAVLVGRQRWDSAAQRRVLIGIVLAILMLPVAWLIFYAVSGVTVFDLLRTALTIHYGLNEPYAPWLLFFPLDLMLFSGLALAILSLMGAVQAARAVIRDPHMAHPEAVLPLALWVAALVLNFSGLVRGEVGRLLLWLMPMIVLAAAPAATPDDRSSPAGVIAISTVLGLQLIVMVGFLRVIGTELAPPPVNSSHPAEVAGMIPLAPARFAALPDTSGEREGAASLIGYHTSAAPDGSALNLTLIWQGDARFDHPYFVSAVVVGPEGQPIGVYDWLPVEGGYPTSCWMPGEWIIDRAQIPLSASLPREAWISVSLFDFDTRTRLPVTLPDGQIDNQIGLGPILLP